MSPNPASIIERRRLRVELQWLRTDVGLTQEQVAGEMKWSLPKFSRIETGVYARTVTSEDKDSFIVDEAVIQRLVDDDRDILELKDVADGDVLYLERPCGEILSHGQAEEIGRDREICAPPLRACYARPRTRAQSMSGIRDREMKMSGESSADAKWKMNSASRGGNCVEVASSTGGQVLVRDTKDHAAGLAVPHASWHALLKGLDRGPRGS